MTRALLAPTCECYLTQLRPEGLVKHMVFHFFQSFALNHLLISFLSAVQRIYFWTVMDK